MIKHIVKFLSKIIIATVLVMCVSSSFAETGDILTEHNRQIFVDNLVGEHGDLVEFQSAFQNQITRDYVPVEARVGIAMMNGLNQIAKILDTSFIRFMIIFIIIMYVFWITLEAYNMMTGDSNANKLVKEIVKKSIILIIWISVLQIGPAKLFLYVVY